LHLYPDVYGHAPAAARRGQLALRALAAAGTDTARVDRAWMRALIRQSRRGPVVVAARELVSGQVPPAPTSPPR
jgi:hypothetical protein